MNIPDKATLEKLQQMQRGAAAAAAVRANGGAPAAIDAVAAPDYCVVAGIILWCYPIATYCAMRGISKWVQRLLTAEAANQAEGESFTVPVEVMIMQVFAFARPQEAYFRMRNGEADYLAHAFKWFDATLTGPDQWENLGKCYRFVLEQTGILEKVNPPAPESMTMTPETAPAMDPPVNLNAPAPAPSPACPQAATPDSSPP